VTTDPSDDVLTRASRPPDQTLRYGSDPDDPEHVVDLRLPAGPVTRPLVVFVHGGFWRAAYDRSHAGPMAEDLSARGWPVATVEYRRMGQPGGGYPGTFDDAAAAIDAALAAGVGTGAPIVAGHSAGGQIALWYAARRPDAVGGVLGLAPVADFATADDRRIGRSVLRELLGGGPDEVPDRYRELDPLGLPLDVPAVLVHGSEDENVPVELSRAYVDAKPNARLVELPGVDHFAVIDPLTRAWPFVLSALAELAELPPRR